MVRKVKGNFLNRNTTQISTVILNPLPTSGIPTTAKQKAIAAKFNYVAKLAKERVDAGMCNLGDVQFVSLLASRNFIVANCFCMTAKGENVFPDGEALRKCCQTIAESGLGYNIRVSAETVSELSETEAVLEVFRACFPENEVQIWYPNLKKEK